MLDNIYSSFLHRQY